MELLSPAADFATARVAFAAGADAVYIGMTSFSARADAKNCTVEELRDLVRYAHSLGRKVYVTFNTVIDDADLSAAIEMLSDLETAAPDALIVQDLGVAAVCRDYFPGLEIHASTQLVAHNLEGVLALKEAGFTRVVLARELPISDIASIAKRCGVEIEVFIHGALCYSISGLCLFSAMEKRRSGNRGRCAYCCRLAYGDSEGRKTLPFSMKDLRLDGQIARLAEAGVVSLKIEGRMKNEIYVGSVTRYYRQILDTLGDENAASGVKQVTREDLETVFSRRTTELYAEGFPKRGTADSSPIDPFSLGHLGAPIGTVKRITKDREGRSWLRFHTNRALEKHDGLQFAVDGSRPAGIGISEMRLAISRRLVFEAPAGSDVEILLPSPEREAKGFISRGSRRPQNEGLNFDVIKPGATVYCSASNAVKRMFPVPPFRSSDYRGGREVSVKVSITADALTAQSGKVEVSLKGTFTAARNPELTGGAVRKAFERMGDAGWTLGSLEVDDAELFAPPSMLNELRRLLVEELENIRFRERTEKISAVKAAMERLEGFEEGPESRAMNILKIRIDQIERYRADFKSYDEVVVSIGRNSGSAVEAVLEGIAGQVRLAPPVFTKEQEFNALRNAVRHLLRAGYDKWEATDLATLRMLKWQGVKDITADWSLYAFNRMAAAELAKLGVSRFVASPENGDDNLADLARLSIPAEFLDVQSTPLFISLTRPAVEDPSHLTGFAGEEFASREIDGLWITIKTRPREFAPPSNARFVRTDRSWDIEG